MRLRPAIAGVAALAVFTSSARANLSPPEPVCRVAEAIRLLSCVSAQPATSHDASRRAEARPLVATFTEPRFDATRIVVRLRQDTPVNAAAALFERVDVIVERRLPALRLYAVRTTADRRDAALRELDASPLVAGAEREIVIGAAARTPNDDGWPAQAGLRVVGLPQAWDLSRSARDVVVAVVDTGVNPAHPDLVGAVEPGWDFVNGDSDAADDHGHGTAAAGVVAALADNREGVAGVCWRCRVVPVKVLAANGSGTSTAVAEGIVWAANRDADVINLSLGAPDLAGALDDAVGYAISKGSLVIAAAGNNGDATPFFPAAVSGVVGVAATDETDRFYTWSNRGSWVAVAAPGCNAAPFLQGYGEFCGTSSAAPVVAGIAALAVARRPSLTPAEFADAIARSATPLGGAVRSGRVNAAAALALIRPQPRLPDRKVTYRGDLSTRMRAYRLTTASGPVVATLRSASPARLMLTLEDGSGRRLAAATGQRRVRVTGTVVERAVVLRVGAVRRTSFVLDVAYVGEPPDVVLSSIADIPPAATLAGGAKLDRPTPGDDPVVALGVRVSDQEALEPAILSAINRLRVSKGLRPLALSHALARAGDAHARALGVAGQFTHDWPDGRQFARWIPTYYPHRGHRWTAGENLLWSDGELTPQQVLDLWLGSPSHRTILLRPGWRELGVGVIRAEEAGGVFGGRSVYVIAAEFGARG
jgi:uncharacterized protein YkwD